MLSNVSLRSTVFTVVCVAEDIILQGFSDSVFEVKINEKIESAYHLF